MLDSVWRYAELWESEVHELPDVLRRELVVCCGLLLVCQHEARLQPCTHAYLTDSSSKGYSLLETSGQSSEFAEIGCYRERWRFRQQIRQNTDLPREASAQGSDFIFIFDPKINYICDSQALVTGGAASGGSKI